MADPPLNRVDKQIAPHEIHRLLRVTSFPFPPGRIGSTGHHLSELACYSFFLPILQSDNRKQKRRVERSIDRYRSV